jgi:hypothetical protein
MGYAITCTDGVKARKSHRCCLCGETINKGDTHRCVLLLLGCLVSTIMRTDIEINNEIVALKNALSLKSRWNAQSREEIEAKIEVLTKRMTPAAVELRWFEDETAEEYRDGDNLLWGDLDLVARWMQGADEEKPSAGFQ